MNVSSRRRCSALYLPASNPRAIDKARNLPCDVVILDLEDAVAPDAKATARDLAVAAVREGGFGPRELVVRVNGLDTEWGKEDLAALATVRPDAVLLPKVNDAAAIDAYARLLETDSVPLWAMIETALSLFRLEEIAATARSHRLAAFVVGTNDLIREIGCRPGTDRLPLLGYLASVVAAAHAHGIAVLDGVFNDLEDGDGLAAQLRQAVRFGFDGKTLIHPNQIGPCNQAFLPADAEIAAARRIIAAFDLPENAARGAIRVDGRMVERLHLDLAQRTLAAAGIQV